MENGEETEIAGDRDKESGRLRMYIDTCMTEVSERVQYAFNILS